MSEEDDDLLKTIRQMVSDEVARGPAEPESVAPNPETHDADEEAAAVPEAQPLVLGAMARVAPEAEAADHTSDSLLRLETSKTPDDLRRVVQEVVREELDLVLGDTLSTRVHQLVRREVAELLMKARSGE